MLGYVGKLLRRMQRRGWRADDALCADIARAEKALHELHVRLIYLAARARGRPSARAHSFAANPATRRLE